MKQMLHTKKKTRARDNENCIAFKFSHFELFEPCSLSRWKLFHSCNFVSFGILEKGLHITSWQALVEDEVE